MLSAVVVHRVCVVLVWMRREVSTTVVSCTVLLNVSARVSGRSVDMSILVSQSDLLFALVFDASEGERGRRCCLSAVCCGSHETTIKR